MTWIALCDHQARRLSLKGLGIDKQPVPLLRDHPATTLMQGSLVFETRLPADGRPQVLLAYKDQQDQLRSLTFQAIPGGGISMVQVQGDRIRHTAIRHALTGRTDVVRMTYSWDCADRLARLTLEEPEETSIATVQIDDPAPLTLSDVRGLMLGQCEHTFAPDMIFAALSDRIEKTGPMPTLLPDAPIATPWGYRAAKVMQRGDTVTTSNREVVPILQTIERSVPARGSFRPVRLRSPYFGLHQDVIVSPDQRLIIDGPEVEYLFGQEAVLVPARHLINGFAAMEEPCGPVITYTQIILPQHESMLIAGAPMESLYIGRLRRRRHHLANSLLAGFDRAMLPEHPRPVHQVLKWYEAIHLARQRAG